VLVSAQVYDVAVGMLRHVGRGDGGNTRISMSSQCYLEDPSATCALCWTSSSEGKREMAACPPAVALAFSAPLPEDMEATTSYPVRYSLALDRARVPLLPSESTTLGGGVFDVHHANIHSCFANVGACTPFVADTPGLSTHTAAGAADLDRAGAADFADEIALEPGTYTIIAHVRFSTVDDTLEGGDPYTACGGGPCTKVYDVAVGTRRTVRPAGMLSDPPRLPAAPAAATSSSIPIVAGAAVGVLAVLVLVGGLVWWAARRGRSTRGSLSAGSSDEELPGMGGMYGADADPSERSLGSVSGWSHLATSRGMSTASFASVTMSKQARKAEAAVGIQDKANLPFQALAPSVIDLHEGIGEECKSRPMRLLLASWVRQAVALPCYEEVPAGNSVYVEVPYQDTTQKMWDATAVVSWRWGKPKPVAQSPEFTPMTDAQLGMMRRYLDAHRSIFYVWVDWCCVPQYGSANDCMVEIARSKLFYSRARMMMVLPVVAPLAEGGMRVALRGVLRELGGRPNNKARRLIASQLAAILEAGVYCEFGYFSRVWTLAERMCRDRRDEKLKHWLSLEAWLGMTFDYLWGASDPRDEGSAAASGAQHYWRRLFEEHNKPEYNARVGAALAELRLIRTRGSAMASPSVYSVLAAVFEDGYEVWRNISVAEALDVGWLRKYLTEEVGVVYGSWKREDAIFAIYTFFCWHMREEFAHSHRDLCTLAGIDETQSLLFHAAPEIFTSRSCMPEPPQFLPRARRVTASGSLSETLPSFQEPRRREEEEEEERNSLVMDNLALMMPGPPARDTVPAPMLTAPLDGAPPTRL